MIKDNRWYTLEELQYLMDQNKSKFIKGGCYSKFSKYRGASSKRFPGIMICFENVEALPINKVGSALRGAVARMSGKRKNYRNFKIGDSDYCSENIPYALFRTLGQCN